MMVMLTIAAESVPGPTVWASAALAIGAFFAVGSSMYRRRGRHRR